MSATYRKAMDGLYLVCLVVAGVSLVLISAVIPWGVYTRYVMNSAASWPEPMAILLTILMTFLGAAACYRLGLHMRVSLATDLLPPAARRIADLAAEALMSLVALFMLVWGTKLVEATWYQSVAEFPFLSVGVTYLPIPVGGAVTALFVIERLTLGRPTGLEGGLHDAAAHE